MKLIAILFLWQYNIESETLLKSDFLCTFYNKMHNVFWKGKFLLQYNSIKFLKIQQLSYKYS